MKSELQTRLAAIAPSIVIETIWTHDDSCGTISQECDGFTPEDDDDWTAWESETRASAIVNGEPVSGSDYLGRTFERYGEDPQAVNPTISGYERGKTEEALRELRLQIPAGHPILAEIDSALAAIA